MKKHLLSQRALILAVSSFTLLLLSSPVNAHAATTAPAVPAAETAVIDTASESFETVSQLPAASFENDLIPGTAAYTQMFLARSKTHPNSIADYKSLGYKNIKYSKWSGVTKMPSTKSKRVASAVATFLAGSFIKKAAIPLGLYAIAQATATQHADIWPTVNTRWITATSPRGISVIIGEESITKYYTNSSRTKLLKTIHHTVFVG
ncbi:MULTISPECIES: hypothetical protein [Lacticaseibacillus]|uniref:hypothetical protein n=1 Tax=Lacticaseibacillus TaxID=2759736 RepID=UPI0019406854|nr:MULTISPECIES: hypothetical protein [Lacticaseibacillus]